MSRAEGRGLCTGCGRDTATRGGLVVRHAGQLRATCPGTGRRPQADTGDLFGAPLDASAGPLFAAGEADAAARGQAPPVGREG